MVRNLKSLAAACAVGLVASQASAVIIWAPDNLGNNNVPGSVGDRIIRFDSANPLGTVQLVGFTGAAGASARPDCRSFALLRKIFQEVV